MIIYLLLLAAGLGLLVKGADLFVEGAAQLARGWHVSPLAVGMTVMAFGCAVPELFVGIAAAVSGHTDIALNTVVGSNIVNILLALGLSALIRPLILPEGTVWKTVPFSLLASLMLWAVASDGTLDGCFVSAVSRTDGLVLLGFFSVFLAFAASVAVPVVGLPHIPPDSPGRSAAVAIKMLVGFSGLLFGGRMTVDGAAVLAAMMGIPDAAISLSAVALGTSLPELTAAVAATRRREAEIAVGTIVGSTVFNIFFILGIGALIRPLPVDARGNVDLGVMTAASILLFVFMFTGRDRIMGRWEGTLALLIYGAYLGYLIYSAFFPGGVGTPAG